MKKESDIVEANIMALNIITNGYGFFKSNYFFNKSFSNDLLKIQSSCFFMPADEKGGNRFRVGSRFRLSGGLLNGKLEPIPDFYYTQPKSYNNELGGVKRKFTPLDARIFKLVLFKKIFEHDLQMAKKMGLVDFNLSVIIDFHIIRYSPSINGDSFSSPPTPHKDNEPIVYIHLLNKSLNLIGGENFIFNLRTDNNYIEKIILLNPLDTLCVVNTKNFHSVSTMKNFTEAPAYRDILLVTFMNEKDLPKI